MFTSENCREKKETEKKQIENDDDDETTTARNFSLKRHFSFFESCTRYRSIFLDNSSMLFRAAAFTQSKQQSRNESEDKKHKSNKKQQQRKRTLSDRAPLKAKKNRHQDGPLGLHPCLCFRQSFFVPSARQMYITAFPHRIEDGDDVLECEKNRSIFLFFVFSSRERKKKSNGDASWLSSLRRSCIPNKIVTTSQFRRKSSLCNSPAGSP